MKRIDGWYISSDAKWLICHEGTATWWFACEADDQGYPEENTKQYFRTYQAAKTYVLEQTMKASAQ
jgi:hypothetical protein